MSINYGNIHKFVSVLLFPFNFYVKSNEDYVYTFGEITVTVIKRGCYSVGGSEEAYEGLKL